MLSEERLSWRPAHWNVILTVLGVAMLAAAASRLEAEDPPRRDVRKVPTETLLAQLESEDFVERCEAGQELAKRKDPALPSILLRLVKDGRPGLRAQAVGVVGRLRDPTHLAQIAAVLNGDSAWRVRASAANALGLMQDARATPALLAALASDDQPEVRGHAAVSLSNYPSCDAVRGLVAAALGDADTWVRRRAESSVMLLTGASSNPAVWKRWVDTNCTGAQAEGGDQRPATPATPPPRKTDPEEPDCEYLAFLAGVPGRTGEQRSREQPDEAASSAVGREDTQPEHVSNVSTGALVSQLQSARFFERFAAREELSKRKDRASLPELLRLVKDERPDVRAEAVEILGHFRDPSLLGTVAAVLAGDSDWVVRYSAANSLAAMRDARAAPVLMAALVKDEWPGVRAQAALALSVYPSCDAARALLAALGDKGPWVAEHAELALMDIASSTDPAAWKRWVDTNCPAPETHSGTTARFHSR
jgi:HEAT repeat protein